MRALIIILAIVGILIVVGCSETKSEQITGATVTNTQQTKQDSEEDYEKVEIEQQAYENLSNNVDAITESALAEPEKEAPAKEEPEESYYDLNKLEDDINEIMGTSYAFKEDEENPDYIKSSLLKYYVIHKTKDKTKFVTSADDFCEKYCAENWDGSTYYVNTTLMNWLHPPLTEKNFSSKNLYTDYVAHAYFINNTIMEKSYDVSNGKVLEYQFIAWTESYQGYFQGPYEGAYLIYKIYCAPNLTVFIGPKAQQIQLRIANQKMPAVFKNWEHQLESIRPDMLEKANKILEKCGVDKEFFNEATFPDYRRSEKSAIYRKTDFAFYFNMSSSINPEIVPPKTEGGEYTLKSVNVSFTNHDFDIRSPLRFKIITITDGKTEEEYFDGKMGTHFLIDETLKRKIAIAEVPFSKNITIKSILYLEEGFVEAKPAMITIPK